MAEITVGGYVKLGMRIFPDGTVNRFGIFHDDFEAMTEEGVACKVVGTDYLPLAIRVQVPGSKETWLYPVDLATPVDVEPATQAKPQDPSLPPGSHRDHQGFLTNPENWKPGKRLF